MYIPLLIGKNSNGEEQLIDLSTIGLLMISYSKEKEINDLFRKIISIDFLYKSFNYIITHSGRLEKWKISPLQAHLFFRDEPSLSPIQSRELLLSMILKEMKRRDKIMAKKKCKNFQHYVSLNTWNQEKLNHCFFIIDDIWDIVKAKPKSMALKWMHILMYGPKVGIHSVFASAISYRNLLEQLVTINPKIKLELQGKYGIPEPNRITALGHELIYSPEGLIFFKMAQSQELVKYYP